MAFTTIAPSLFDFSGVYEIRQGADWEIVVTVTDENGAPLDLSEYSTIDCDFLNAIGGTTSGSPQPTISFVGGGSGGEIKFVWPNATTTAATVHSGIYQLEIVHTSTSKRTRILYGSWSMDTESTI